MLSPRFRWRCRTSGLRARIRRFARAGRSLVRRRTGSGAPGGGAGARAPCRPHGGAGAGRRGAPGDFSAYLSGTLRPASPAVCGSRERVPARPKDAPRPKEAAILRSQVGKERNPTPSCKRPSPGVRRARERPAPLSRNKRIAALPLHRRRRWRKRLPQRQRELDDALALQAKRPAAAARVEQRRKRGSGALRSFSPVRKNGRRLPGRSPRRSRSAEEVVKLTVEDRPRLSAPPASGRARGSRGAGSTRPNAGKDALPPQGGNRPPPPDSARRLRGKRRKPLPRSALRRPLERGESGGRLAAEENLEPARPRRELSAPGEGRDQAL